MDIFKRRVGEKIRKRRKEMGFATQKALADKLDVDTSRVTRWETGANIPDSKHRDELLRLLNLSENDLFGEVPPAQITTGDRATLIGRITLLLPTLDDDELRAIFESVEAMPSLRDASRRAIK